MRMLEGVCCFLGSPPFNVKEMATGDEGVRVGVAVQILGKFLLWDPYSEMLEPSRSTTHASFQGDQLLLVYRYSSPHVVNDSATHDNGPGCGLSVLRQEARTGSKQLLRRVHVAFLNHCSFLRLLWKLLSAL